MTARDPQDDRPRRLSPQLGYSILVAFLAVVGISGAGVAYTNHVQRESDNRWCSLLIQLTDAQRAAPPPTESGKKFAAELERLRSGFRCPKS